MSYTVCKLCGNMETTELNIEGYIHHNRPILCFDKEACKKRVKKKRNHKRKMKLFRASKKRS